MSFGKRNHPVKQRAARPQTLGAAKSGAADDLPPDGPGKGASPLGGQLRTIVGGVVIGLTLIIGSNLILLPMLGRAQKEAFETPPGERALRAMKGDKSFDNFALLRSCEPPNFGLTLPSRSHGPRDLEQAKALSAGFGDAMAEGAAARKLADFITCTLRTQQHRYCSRQQRKITVAQVEQYLAMRRQGLRAFARASRMSVAEVEAFYNKMRTEHGGHLEIRAIAERSSNPEWVRNVHSVMEVDEDLIAAIKVRISDGYFSADDFARFLGLFMPAELEPHLASVKKEASPCS